MRLPLLITGGERFMRIRVLVSAAVATLVAVLVFGVPDAGRLRAQAPGAAPTKEEFDVATVKQNKSGDGRVLLGFPGGRFTATNVPLRGLIAAAYGDPQPLPNFRIIGGPSWVDSDRFDIIAKPPDDVQPTPGPQTRLFLMLRTLLADRFKLVTHTEMRDLPVYDLVMARSDGRLGPQLKKSDVDCAALFAARRGGAGALPPPPGSGEVPMCGMFGSPGRIAGGSVSMTQLAGLLSRMVARPVNDKTGLAGNYNVDVTFTPEQLPQGTPPPGAPPLPPIDPNGPSIYTAIQEQLGLKLDSQKAPVNVIVIDSVEHPTDD